jgi:hypothetical protein
VHNAAIPSAHRSGPAKMQINKRYQDDAHCIAWIGNVQIILSKEAPTSAIMRTIIRELDALSKDCGGGTGALLVINSDCKPPSEEARAYIRAELANSSMVAAAQVVEGTGFRGAAMRAVLSVLQLAARTRYPMEIFSGVEEGAHWMCGELRTRLKRAPEPAALVSAVRALQAVPTPK